MILCHARAMAHSAIYRTSNQSAVYPKTADVPDADAEDWEPVPQVYAPPVVTEDCGCGDTTEEEPDVTD